MNNIVLTLLMIVVFAPSALLARQDMSDVEIQTITVADGVYMLMGQGGNIGLSVGEDGGAAPGGRAESSNVPQ